MDRDFSRSRAILVSNAVFSDARIPDLPGAVGCAPAMEALLTSDLCGWPCGRVESLQDVAAPPELARKLVELTESVQDALLLYYVGHGMRMPSGQLALALRDTISNRTLLRHTAMVYKDIADILRGCPATTKLVILDCCHAELGNRASDQFQSTDIDAEPVDGLYCIWASKEWEKARSPISGGLTYFTDAFINVVRTGIPGKPSWLTIDQVFTELRARMLRASLPEPAQSGIRDAHHWPFARNAAPPETYYDPAREIAHLLQQKAAAEERERVLRATVAERTAEVERLQKQVEESESRSAAQQQRLDADLRIARARLSAATTAQAESRQTADSVNLALASEEAKQSLQPREDATTPSTSNTQQQEGGAGSTERRVHAPDVRDKFYTDEPPGAMLSRDRLARKGRAQQRAAGPPTSGPGRVAGSGGGSGGASGSGTKVNRSGRSGGEASAARSVGAVHAPPHTPGSQPITRRKSEPKSVGGTRRRGYWYAASAAALAAGAIFALFTIPSHGANPQSKPTATPSPTATHSGTAKIAPRLTTRISPHLFRTLNGRVTTVFVAYSPDGKTLVTANLYGGINIWDLAAGRKIASPLLEPYYDGNTQWWASIAYSPNGKTWAVEGGGNSIVSVWNAATKRITVSLDVPNCDSLSNIAYGPGGTTLVTACNFSNAKIYLWDVATGHIISVFDVPPNPNQTVYALAYSPNGTTFVTADNNNITGDNGNLSGKTYLWDVATGRIVATLADPRSQGANSVAYSANGTTVATSDSNGNIYLWDVATGREIATLTSHCPGAGTVVFSPDGTTLASVCGLAGNKIDLWDIATRHLLTTFADPVTQGIDTLVYSPDGTSLAAGDENGNIYVWTDVSR